MAPTDRKLLRWSLAFVWLATAVVSLIEIHGQSRNLLADAGISNPLLINGLIVGGAAVDGVLGLALLLSPRRAVLIAALLVMGAMTLVATVLTPSLWLHPLGPLSKNLPIAVILFVLYRNTL